MTDVKVSDIDQPKAKINVMDSQTVRRLCVERGLYSTPELNEKLYLHFQGFRKIENLEQYTDVCSLFLDNNSLSKIENLDHMTKLKQLYIQNNLLKQLDNLEKLSGLLTLNIGSNQVASLEGIASLAALTTLVANDNQIQDLSPLRSCTSLTSIDLTKNQVSDEQGLFSVLEGLPALKCLYLKENPVVSKLPHYRRVIINRLPGLTFLDDRPISAEERRCTSAWEKNGREAEAVERQRIQQEKVDKMNANMIAWRKMKENARSYRGLPPSNPATSDEHNDSDNETQDQTPSRAKIELIEDDEEDAEDAKARTAAEELAAVRDLSFRDVAAVVYRSQTGENLPVLAEKNEFDATFNDVNFIAQEKRRVWKEEQDWLPPAPSHEEKPHTTDDSKADAETASQPSSDSDEDVFIGEQPPSKRFSSVPASQTHLEPHQTVSGTLVPAPIASGPRVVAVPITNDEEESSSEHSEEAPQTLEQLSDDAIFGSGLLCPHIVPPSCQWDDDKDDEDEPEEPVQLPERPSDPQESQSDSEEDSTPVKLPMFEVLGNLVSIQSLQRSNSAELKTVGMHTPSVHAGGSEETEEEDAENDEAIIDAREVLKRLDLFRDPEDKEASKESTEKQTEKEEPSVSAVSQTDESIEKNAEQTIDL